VGPAGSAADLSMPGQSMDTPSRPGDGRHEVVPRTDIRMGDAVSSDRPGPAGGPRSEQHAAARSDTGYSAVRAGAQPAPGSPPAANVAAAQQLSPAPGRESVSAAVPEADARGTAAPRTAAGEPSDAEKIPPPRRNE